jgi:hypothetical protein
MSDEPIIVAEFARNSREVVRVLLDKYRGHDIVSIRTFYRNAAEEWLPGRSGMSMSIRHLPALVKALTEAADLAGVRA